ncbi:MAG: restriction endonuclease subunit S [Nitrosomonas sp.]|nr:restriction endonuclease subunit S [Nitrosomonas sp.]
MVRPGYKETEVGEIPEDWEISTIGNNTRWLSGGTPSRDNSEYWNGTVPWISGSTLKSSEIFTSDQFLTKEAVAIGSKMAPLNSTLLLVRGSALHSEIRAGMVVAPVSFNQDVKALIPDRTIEPKFLTFYILGQMGGLLKLVSSAGNSAGVLDTELVKNFCFLKPELKEQKAIAKALSDVDELIISLEKLIAKKRDIKTATMQQLLTGKKRLPGFGGEWNLIRIENDANLKARIGWQALTTKEYLDSGKYYLVTGTDFVGGKVNWSTCHFVDEWRYDQDRNIQLKKGDVLLTKDGTIGKVGYVDHFDLVK